MCTYQCYPTGIQHNCSGNGLTSSSGNCYANLRTPFGGAGAHGGWSRRRSRLGARALCSGGLGQLGAKDTKAKGPPPGGQLTVFTSPSLHGLPAVSLGTEKSPVSTGGHYL